MASAKDLVFTDEELCRELEKLGYKDVPEEVFLAMKKDLLALADKKTDASEKASISFEKHRTFELSEKNVNKEQNDLSSPESVVSPRSFIEYKNRYKLYKIRRERKLLSSASSETNSDTSMNTESKIKRKILRRINGRPIITEELLDMPGAYSTSYTESDEKDKSLEKSRSSSDTHDSPVKASQVMNRKCSVVQRISRNASSYRENHEISKMSLKKPISYSNTSSVSISPKSSEESSRNHHTSQADSSIDSSKSSLPTSNSSINHHTTQADSSIDSSKSSLSNSTESRSTSLNSSGSPSISQITQADSSTDSSKSSLSISNSTKSTSFNSNRSPAVYRKKKNDPVAMYNYYKKFWNNFKPPGEKSHDKLRWAVRDKMLEYSL